MRRLESTTAVLAATAMEFAETEANNAQTVASVPGSIEA
jgi:hypothetical protein